MNVFEQELVKKLGADSFDKLQQVHAGIAGCGGLGSNCAANLVRSGFKKITIVDFDKVDVSNLNRQFYFQDQIGMDKTEALKINLERINPDIQLAARTVKIVPENIEEIFRYCDIIVEAFDRPECKSMLVERLYGKKKLVVCASGLCGWGDCDAIKTRILKPGLILVGDQVTDFNQKPPISPRVNIAAAKQADAILDFVINSY